MKRKIGGLLLSLALAAPVAGAAQTITSGRIKNETIQAIDIAPESITTGRILNRTIKAIDIQTEAITTGEIKNGTIAGVDLANGAVTEAKLSAGVVDRLAPASELLNIAGVSMVPRADGTGVNVCVIATDSTDTLADGLAKETFGMLASGTANYFANVALPQGVVVTAFRFHGVDGSSTAEATARLFRRRFTSPATATDAPEQMAGVNTGVAFSTADIFEIEVTEIVGAEIDNDNYYYFVAVDLGCQSLLTVWALGVQIEYTR
jgi:hypothetical protein